jgi:biopolymer transport protein ExbD
MIKTVSKDALNGVGDMRTRYVPDVRFRHGLLRMAPWLDMVLVILYLLLLHSRVVLQPGVVVELPAAQSDRGLISPLIAVALVAGTPQAPVYRVFFDNVQYALDNEKRLEALRAALAEKRIHMNATALTLYADRRIEHRDLMRLLQLAQEAGMQRINLGTQPVDAKP